MENFYVAKDWFDMNDLDLQSPTKSYELVISFGFIYFHSYLIFFHLCCPNLDVHFFVHICDFFIKVLVCNVYVLNVLSSELQDMGHILREMVGSTTLLMPRTSP